jgi:hypothetical protein
MMASLKEIAAQHLMLRLLPINRALRAAVHRQTEAAARLSRPDLTELCVTADQVEHLLDDADALAAQGKFPEPRVAQLLPAELEREEQLREAAREDGYSLPLDRMSLELGLIEFEVEALLLCAAPEIDRAFERIFAYVLDDLQRRAPCVELVATLTAASSAERLARRAALGRFGRLRRCGLVRPVGESSTEWRQELRLGQGVLEFLLGEADTLALFRDPAVVSLPPELTLPLEVDPGVVDRLGVALDSGAVLTVGVWGAPADGTDEVVMALARAAGRSLRRFIVQESQPGPVTTARDAIEAAAAGGAILWIAADALATPASEGTRAALASLLALSTVPACLSGVHPWRPATLLAARPYADLPLPSATFRSRKALWKAQVPELSDAAAADYAARLRIGSAEVQAIAQVARTAEWLSSLAGTDSNLESQIDDASATVLRKRADHIARVVISRYGPEDLILPPDLHQQVLEVAHFFQAWPRVAEEWSVGPALLGSRGVKALFTGDPGTGKTLAAEVIAGVLKLPLFKVDLAQVVSKWVGETEKNLESVFKEAEESHAVLFFDEADALFGKRGEVQNGTDRYANLEVSYLLQRLEDFDGLVILASNLKDQIDVAFTRRFHVALHFPRPREEERRQIWQRALWPPEILEPGIDVEMLARLDLTGAGIVGAARTAALLAAKAGRSQIGMVEIVEAVARQYRRESRVLVAGDLGRRMLLGDARA